MVRRDQQAIEQLGISKLKDELWAIRHWTDNFFSENDKTPLLDGNILLYSSDKHSNANLIGSISCQIKSTTAKNVKKYHKYYRLDRDDLAGIEKMGGAMLFVIWIKGPNNYKVYYQRLTRLYITQLLEKSNAKNPSIPLTEFPSDSNKKINILRQAAFDLNATIANNLVEIKNPDEIIIPTYMLDPNDFKSSMEGLENQSLTIYAKKEGSLHPLALINNDDIELIKTGLDIDKVSFGSMGPFDVKRFSSQKKKYNEPIIYFITGASSKLTITVHNPSQKKNRVTMKVNKADNVSDQLTNIKIMKYLATNGKINVDGTTIDLSNHMVPLDNEKLKEIDRWIDELSAIKEISQKLNINFYRDYENEQLINQLNILLNFVNDRDGLTEHEIVPGVFNYGDKLIGIIKTRDNYWNFFDRNLVSHFQLLGALESSRDQLVVVNPYLIAQQSQKSITRYIGYNFDIIFNWFTSHVESFEKEVIRNQATIFCEDLIMNAESSERDVWQQINKLQTLMGHFEDNRLFLDHQLIQRKLGHKITIDENERLIKLAKAGNTVEKLYADYLLNIEMDQELIESLNKEELDWLERIQIVTRPNK